MTNVDVFSVLRTNTLCKLSAAILSDDWRTFQNLLDEKCELSVKDNRGFLPIHYAAGCENENLPNKYLQRLINDERHCGQISLDVESYAGCTPLIIAIKNYDFHKVNMLLLEGADPNLSTSMEARPLHTALMLYTDGFKDKTKKIVESLLSHQADPNLPADDIHFPTAAHDAAAYCSDEEIFKLLSFHDTDFFAHRIGEGPEQTVKTPLHHALKAINACGVRHILSTVPDPYFALTHKIAPFVESPYNTFINQQLTHLDFANGVVKRGYQENIDVTEICILLVKMVAKDFSDMMRHICGVMFHLADFGIDFLVKEFISNLDENIGFYPRMLFSVLTVDINNNLGSDSLWSKRYVKVMLDALEGNESLQIRFSKPWDLCVDVECSLRVMAMCPIGYCLMRGEYSIAQRLISIFTKYIPLTYLFSSYPHHIIHPLNAVFHKFISHDLPNPSTVFDILLEADKSTNINACVDWVGHGNWIYVVRPNISALGLFELMRRGINHASNLFGIEYVNSNVLYSCKPLCAMFLHDNDTIDRPHLLTLILHMNNRSHIDPCHHLTEQLQEFYQQHEETDIFTEVTKVKSLQHMSRLRAISVIPSYYLRNEDTLEMIMSLPHALANYLMFSDEFSQKILENAKIESENIKKEDYIVYEWNGKIFWR